MKIKNVPKSLKCKINTKFFLDKWFPKGGGSPTFGKNSQIMSYFFSESVPMFIKMLSKPTNYHFYFLPSFPFSAPSQRLTKCPQTFNALGKLDGKNV